MDVYDILAEVERNLQSSVLATVIYVEGHAYRKAGAMMLLNEDGSSIGSISPGCLEADLFEYVPAVWTSKCAQVVEYDMRPSDDWGWGESIGCGGLIRVLLEPVTEDLRSHLISVKTVLDRGESIYLNRTIAERVQYELQSANFADTVTRHDHLAVYAYLFTPKPRLVIFGANQDAGPLAQLAHSTGFHVVVADWRPGLCESDWFAGIETVCEFPRKLAEELELSSQDYVIVMSHQFQKDQEFLQTIAGCSLRYLGIMGSAVRTEALLEGLPRPESLHYPVGHRIGSEGPMENAISIMAELISVRRGAAGATKRGSLLAEGRGLESLGGW